MLAAMNKNRLWLLIIILIALALRLTQLGEQSLWYDEGVTWMLSKMQLADLIDWTAADIQPPLYYLLIWSTDILFGQSEWALRFPSLFFGVLTVPALYRLAQCLFPARRATALIAAALVAISPLMVYYSQEARMYTLLTLEAILASILLLKIMNNYQLAINNDTPSPYSLLLTPYPLLYALTAAAALYTHYFAAFLLVAHAIYAAYIWWQRRFPRPLLMGLTAAFGLTLLLYLPWLPVLLARLGDDPSYWPGALKLNEAGRKILISFTTGETVFEQTGWWLALLYFGLLILGFSWTLITQPPIRNSQSATPNSHIFLLLWLILPIALILALTYQSPKFNPRYALLAWPALALLTAHILSRLLSAIRHASRAVTRLTSVAIFTLFTIFILATSGWSLANWFTDPRFSKDDFQALAQFVKERQAPDETVLLSSGHLFPVWAYYYGWEGWTPLPWMLRLDVNKITNLEIATDIAAAIEGQQGVWLVTWQDEVIDPNGVIPFWLDLIGQRPNDAGDFWGVGLEHWRLDPTKTALLHENPIKIPAIYNPQADTEILEAETSYNFANQVELLGMTQLDDTEMILFWRPLQPLPDNLVMSLSLTDRQGFRWSRQPVVSRPGSYLYPPSRWPVGQIVLTHHQLPWQIGTPPGLYVAEIELGTAGPSSENSASAQTNPQFTGWDILDRQGRPQRRTALIDFVNLSQLVQPETGPLPQEDDPLIDLFPIIGLRRSILPDKTAQPGDRLLLALLWQAGDYNLDDVSLTFEIVDAEGQTHPAGQSFTPSRNFNLPRWKPQDVVLGQYWLDIPPQAAPGPATLQLHIINVAAYSYDEVFPFDQLEILPTERNFVPPQNMDMTLSADFSGKAVLIGANCTHNCRAAAGETVTLTLYWQATAAFETDFTIFTHLLGPEEAVVINADHAPPKPTPGWVSGEIITDPVTLTIPNDLSPGAYLIEAGLYNANDPAFTRLPLNSGKTRVILPQPLIVE